MLFQFSSFRRYSVSNQLKSAPSQGRSKHLHSVSFLSASMRLSSGSGQFCSIPLLFNSDRLCASRFRLDATHFLSFPFLFRSFLLSADSPRFFSVPFPIRSFLISASSPRCDATPFHAGSDQINSIADRIVTTHIVSKSALRRSMLFRLVAVHLRSVPCRIRPSPSQTDR